MDDDEAILEKVKELFDNTLKELTEIKDHLLVLQSSELYIAETSTHWIGYDSLSMIIEPFLLFVKKFNQFIKRPLNHGALEANKEKIDILFDKLEKPITIFELYIGYRQLNIAKSEFYIKERLTSDIKSFMKSNGHLAKKVFDRLVSVYCEFSSDYNGLLPKEDKSSAA